MAHGRTTVVAAVLALVVAGGCGLTGSHDKVAAGPGAAAETTEPAVEPTTETPETPSPTPSRTPSKKPTKKATKKPTRAVATQDPFWDQLPDCAHYDSTKPIAKSKVKTALKAASTRVYWRTEAPQLRLNYPLVKAVAWQESGWKSNIHNCDGGTGVMQVMPGTVDQINNRFGLSYDPAKYQDNAYVGANYLAWLTKWAGDRYFGGSYSLSTGKCKSHTSWCLLNVVISGYNAGQGGLEAAEGAKKLPNPQYVGAVRALMTRCQCDQY